MCLMAYLLDIRAAPQKKESPLFFLRLASQGNSEGEAATPPTIRWRISTWSGIPSKSSSGNEGWPQSALPYRLNTANTGRKKTKKIIDAGVIFLPVMVDRNYHIPTFSTVI